MLFYLNKRWQPEWGGRIELSKDPWVPPQEDPMHKVMDVGFNRAVIFATSEHSWHGFKQVELPPEEQAAGTSRKLISLYSTCTLATAPLQRRLPRTRRSTSRGHLLQVAARRVMPG